MLKPLNCMSYVFAYLSIINISFCQEMDYKYDYKYRLYRAIRDGRLEEVKSIVSLHPDALNGQLYTHNRDRKTPLHCAAEFDQVAILEFLVKAGADKNSRSVHRDTPLASAIRKGHINSVKYLVEAGADTTTVDVHKLPALHMAIRLGQLTLVQYFMDLGLDTDILRLGDTLLHIAAENGQTAILEFLLKTGQSIKDRNRFGETPLYCACQSNVLSSVKLLLEKGAEIYSTHCNNNSLLYELARSIKYASRYYCSTANTILAKFAIVELLVKFGLSIDQTTAQELERQHVPYQQWIREKNDELREILKNTDAADLPRDLQRFLLTFILSRVES